MKVKIFGIGFHKTGTTTLEVALKKMGYSVCVARPDLLESICQENWYSVWAVVDKYDAFEDNPWPLIYQKLDRQYPNSKFILTVRDESKWIKSITRHFKTKSTPMREWIYGVGFPQNNEAIYLNRYRKHNQEVINYFQNRPEDLLIVDWEKNHAWQELCQFLDQPLISEPFPHTHASKYPTPIERVLSNLKSKVKEMLKINS